MTIEKADRRVLVTGSAGFIGGYVVEELLSRGYRVTGIDNYSKYGPVTKSYDSHPDYRFVEGDVRDVDLLEGLLEDCDHLIAGAALIGGISYFHAYAYDLLATNERIMAATCDAAIRVLPAVGLRKVTYLSSSMVFESATALAVEGGRRARHPTTAVVVRVPEAGRGVLRQSGLGPVPPAVHRGSSLQLRRRRRGAGPWGMSRSPVAT